ncbi:hypothetical protein [Kaistella pullorum]|uniref:Conjugal transfer protein n=1 Tax=Kaistella pullorum TaxID=2763074 RepID=A0ABR8WPR0_9FLAO|nr:hypothetical protein [Kaistella pullorum]MBD8019058.1 hypothetical protein [Kaistella pullorum]
MKSLILAFSLMVGSYTFAQMAVVDAGANHQMAKQITQSAAQIKQLEKSYQLMKDAQDKYNKVNGYIQQMGQLQNIINLQKQAISNSNKILQKARAGKIDVSSIGTQLSQISGSIKTVQALLNNGMFKMSDSERITLLENEYNKVKSANAKLSVKLIKLSY